MTELARTVFRCRHCGREIAADHNLASLNLERHVRSCLEMEKVKESKMHRRMMRRGAKSARQVGVGSTIVPSVGQLGMPFDGVPVEVVS